MHIRLTVKGPGAALALVLAPIAAAPAWAQESAPALEPAAAAALNRMGFSLRQLQQ